MYVSFPLPSLSAYEPFSGRYVEFGLAQEMAAAVKNTEQFISNEYFHGAIRTDGPAVFKQLFKLSKREYE